MPQHKILLFFQRHRTGWQRLLRLLIVCMIPVLAGLMIFKNLGVYPFGENSILSIDLWGQYYPMFREYANADSLADTMYSWNGALGFNTFVQSAFYCRSLFLIPFRFIPINASLIYIDTVCILRWGLSAATCLLFLEYKFKKPSVLLMAASIGYGLCAYSLAYIMQFMWTDLMIYAPLVLLGLERLLDNKSPLLYGVALGLTIYTNFYVAFGTCIFTALYYAAETVKRAEYDRTRPLWRRVSNFKSLRQLFFRFAGCSLAAAAINAVVLIPTLIGLSKTSSASVGTVDFSKWYHTLADNLSALLPQTEISLGYGVANIAAGLFLFLLVPLYFFNTAVRFRDKLSSGVFLVLLYIGLNYNPADYLFNGCHFPNQLPGRWSFLFSLALITVAANGIMKPQGVKSKSVLSAYIAGVFFLLLSKYGELSDTKADSLGRYIVWLSIAAALLMIFVIVHERYEAAKALAATEEALTNSESDEGTKPSKRTTSKVRAGHIGTQLIACSLALFITLEISGNAVRVASADSGGIGTSSMTHYLHATNVFDTFGAMYDSDETTFYRMENNGGWTMDDGQLGNYKGMTYYGSTMNGNVYTLLRAMGNRVYTLNISSLYNNSSPVQNGLFGIRYFIDKSKTLDKRLSGIRRHEEYEDCIIWENPTALPLGFAADEKILTFSLGDELCPLETQNRLVNALYGTDVNVFEKHDAAVSYENCELRPSDKRDENYYHCFDTSKPVIFEYTFVTKNNTPVYIEQNFRAGKMFVHVNDTATEVNIGTEPFKYVGCYPAGTEVRVRVEASGHQTGCYGLDFYHFNTTVWNKVCRQLQQQSLTVTSFESTKVTGTVTMETDGLLYTSIPQDGGWTAYVDGRKVNTFTIADCLLGIAVGEGSHTVTFCYRVPGILDGVVISLITAALCLLYLRRYYKTHPKDPTQNDPMPSASKKRPTRKKQSVVHSPRVMIDDPL